MIGTLHALYMGSIPFIARLSEGCAHSRGTFWQRQRPVWLWCARRRPALKSFTFKKEKAKNINKVSPHHMNECRPVNSHPSPKDPGARCSRWCVRSQDALKCILLNSGALIINALLRICPAALVASRHSLQTSPGGNTRRAFVFILLQTNILLFSESIFLYFS